MNRQMTISILAGSVSLILGGCVQTTTQWDRQFGESARMAAARQTLNPDAGKQAVPEAVDGHAAREAVGTYRSSFKEPAQNTNSFVIGVGR